MFAGVSSEAPAKLLEVAMLLGFITIVVIVALVIVAADRHLCLKDIEKDLKLMLGDFLIARDLSSEQTKVHYQATVFTIKSLIRRHFEN